VVACGLSRPGPAPHILCYYARMKERVMIQHDLGPPAHALRPGGRLQMADAVTRLEQSRPGTCRKPGGRPLRRKPCFRLRNGKVLFNLMTDTPCSLHTTVAILRTVRLGVEVPFPTRVCGGAVPIPSAGVAKTPFSVIFGHLWLSLVIWGPCAS
jgi:hypothetical protein